MVLMPLSSHSENLNVFYRSNASRKCFKKLIITHAVFIHLLPSQLNIFALCILPVNLIKLVKYKFSNISYVDG